MAITVQCDKTQCIYNDNMMCKKKHLYFGELYNQYHSDEMYCECYSTDEDEREE